MRVTSSHVVKAPAVVSIRALQELLSRGIEKLEDGTLVSAEIAKRVRMYEARIREDVARGEAQLRNAQACHVHPNSATYRDMERWLEHKRELLRIWRARHAEVLS